MSVESWDPGAARAALEPVTIARFLEAAGHLDAPRFGLEGTAAGELAPLARQRPEAGADWAAAAARLQAADLEGLIRLFTLAESRLAGWEAGDASPVIPLVRELKRREAYPPELHAWIKANTENRFLPYGNLMDRL